jgi:hypothetical protein
MQSGIAKSMEEPQGIQTAAMQWQKPVTDVTRLLPF